MKNKTADLPINQILEGNVMSALRTLPTESVDMVVTSPPYWGLRSYGTNPQVWGGDPNCSHQWPGETKNRHLHRGDGTRKENLDDSFQVLGTHHDRCQRCKAWRGELGLEPYFFEYVGHLCDVFDEVRRVLKKEGTLWVNLGDTYANSGGMQKSLCQIPSRFAIEMCVRGWILRNELIWWKPNCMPSSAKDRFTVDFEKIFFFAKSAKYYFERQFEPHTSGTHARGGTKRGATADFRLSSQAAKLGGWNDLPPTNNPYGRGKRAVWRLPARPFPEAHFATFPPALVETPIRAGCPEFVCTGCGKPCEKIYFGKSHSAFNIRIRDVQARRMKHIDRKASKDEVDGYVEAAYGGSGRTFNGYTDCGCGATFEPGIVLDPFMGSGTTAAVALALNRRFIGIELNAEYIAIAENRIRDTA